MAEVASVPRLLKAFRRLPRGDTGYLQPAFTLVLLVVLWEVAVAVLRIPSFLLPPPSDVWSEFLVRAGELPGATWYTLRVTLVGFGLSVVLGILLAIPLVYSRMLQNSILPLLLLTQSVPKVALAPLLLVWVGYGETSAIVIAFLVAFFPMVVNTTTGLRAVEPELIDMSKSLSASRWDTFRKVRFPSALPYVFSGAKVAVTLALIGAVIGEFVGSDDGLGHMIQLASSYLNTSLGFVAILMLSLMGIVLYYAVHGLERLMIPWFDQSSDG